MKKGELVDYVAEQAGISKASAKSAVDAVLDGIGNALEKKDSIIFPGFGSFKTSERSARVGRNPQNGESINIPAQVVAQFKPGTDLKKRLNK